MHAVHRRQSYASRLVFDLEASPPKPALKCKSWSQAEFSPPFVRYGTVTPCSGHINEFAKPTTTQGSTQRHVRWIESTATSSKTHAQLELYLRGLKSWPRSSDLQLHDWTKLCTVHMYMTYIERWADWVSCNEHHIISHYTVPLLCTVQRSIENAPLCMMLQNYHIGKHHSCWLFNHCQNCTVLYCNALHCTAPHCILLHCICLHCLTYQDSGCNTLHCVL